jgi:hypothetical protein
MLKKDISSNYYLIPRFKKQKSHFVCTENKPYKINMRFRIKTHSQNMVIVLIAVLKHFRITRINESVKYE